ncbi:MAG TPA: NYN domain-containing protein [Candidatus Paceibacterota bacterium]
MAVVKHSAQRVGVFIDTANLYHSAKNLYKSKVNFGNVVKDALSGRTLIRAIGYVIATEGGEEKAFFDALAKMGIETKSKDLQIFYGGAKKADWDVGITVDVITMAPKLDVAIIVSGDGDYVPLIEYLKMHGVQVEVAAFGRSTSSKLRESTDSFLDLCDHPEKYLMRSMRRGPGRSDKSESEETLSKEDGV